MVGRAAMVAAAMAAVVLIVVVSSTSPAKVVAMEQVPQQQELASVDWQSLKPVSAAQAQQLEEAKPAASAFSLGGSLNLPPPAPVPIKNLQIKAVAPPPAQPPTVVRFTGPISVQRPSPCPSCCLKCPGGVCTKACNKMLLEEIFKKMYASNEARINKLEYFMKENKKRIQRSETRITKLKTMEDNAYDKMKQLLSWNDKNLRKKIVTKEDSYGPRGEEGPPGMNGKDGQDGLPGEPGPVGPPGDPGPQGVQGPQGLYGPAGQQGPIGPKGPEGPEGNQGEAGPEGPVGPIGAVSLQVRCDRAGGWITLGNNKCLKITTKPTNFHSAQAACTQWGGNVFAPQSMSELKAATERMRRNDYWVGMQRSEEGGNKWENVDGSATGFLESRWGSGMPNNAAGAENCVQALAVPGTENTLGDLDCNAQRPFFCMKSL